MRYAEGDGGGFAQAGGYARGGGARTGPVRPAPRHGASLQQGRLTIELPGDHLLGRPSPFNHGERPSPSAANPTGIQAVFALAGRDLGRVRPVAWPKSHPADTSRRGHACVSYVGGTVCARGASVIIPVTQGRAPGCACLRARVPDSGRAAVADPRGASSVTLHTGGHQMFTDAEGSARTSATARRSSMHHRFPSRAVADEGGDPPFAPPPTTSSSQRSLTEARTNPTKRTGDRT